MRKIHLLNFWKKNNFPTFLSFRKIFSEVIKCKSYNSSLSQINQEVP